MTTAGERPVVLALVGLTGTGKTDLAIELARRIDGEVISCDSLQVYRGMDIGTAKASALLRAEIRHHLIDVCDPDSQMSAGDYAERARAAAREILARGRRPILCGGTGLYARAFAGGLLGGVAAPPELRERLRACELPELVSELTELDPLAARTIPPTDRLRIERALEIAILARAPASALRAEHAFSDRPFDVRWLALDLERSVLARRIEARVQAMFRAGFVEEVRALWAAGYTRRYRPLGSIGYREVGFVLDGTLALAEAQERIVKATRRLAKRQRTWFRSEPGLRFADAAEPERVLEAALAELSLR